MSVNPDDEVSNLLISWGLGDLKAKFKANYIVLQALEYLTEEDIVELIPKIGQRAIFRGRLTQWRQQNGITHITPLKVCKLEPGTEAKSEEQQINKSPIQAPSRFIRPEPGVRHEPGVRLEKTVRLAKLEPAKQYPVRQIPAKIPVKRLPPREEPTKQSPPQINHKIYGTLTKCNSKSQKPSESTSTSTMQSKVQQFYISPPVVDTTLLPPIPTPTPAPVSPLAPISTPTPISPPEPRPRTIIRKADLGPFVTSIIRVETACDKKTSSSATQNKVNRTTILQKLNNSQRTTSPSNSPPKNIEEQRAEEDDHEMPEPLYPIVKLETELIDPNWNSYKDVKREPEPDPEPEPQPQQDPDPESDEAANKDDDDLMVDSSDVPTECVETLDSGSALEFDSENENKSLVLPIPRRRRKRKRRIDIRNILMNSEMGRHVLNYYEANERLDWGRRRMLIEAIAHDCWKTNKCISPSDCREIADEIIEILPNERVEDYYLAQPGRNTKSPLYNKYRNLRKRFREKGLPLSVRRKKRKSEPRQIPEMDEVEVDEDVIIS